jgi:hypothetical protein
MTSRERVVGVLNFKEVDRFPRTLWALPSASELRQKMLEEMDEEFEFDIGGPVGSYGKGKRCTGEPYVDLMYTDAWGCVWVAGEEGVVGEVKNFPLSDWAALDNYELPWELLDQADLTGVNEGCKRSDKFILANTGVRPFERMQFLRGTEDLFVDLALDEPELHRLKDMLHDFYIKEIEMWVETDVDGIQFMDDWGSQRSLLISPALWQKIFKPMYKEYCDIIRGKGKYVFFHSDGNIESIYPDLIEIGIHAVNSQLFCMDIERLGKQYAGQITFWGEIDRQHILPFGTVQDVKSAVDRVASALMKHGKTGIIAQCEWGKNDPIENIKAVFEQWDTY